MTHAAARRVLYAALCVCALIALAAVSPTAQQKPEVALKAAIDKEVVEGDLKAAIGMYRTLAASADRAVAAQALLRMGQCYEKLGAAESAEAHRAYERVVVDFADHPQLAAQAKARIAALAETAVRPDTGGPVLRQIWPTSGEDYWYKVSPDGRFVVGVDKQTGDLVVRGLATSDTRRLTAIPKDRWWDDFADDPAWSPDGRRIGYTWYSDDTAQLRIVDVADGTSRLVELDEPLSPVEFVGWSSDGQQVLALLREEAPSRRRKLAWLSLSDRSVITLATVSEGERFGGAAVSPDGAWVVYLRLSSATAPSAGLVSTSMYVISSRSGSARELSPGTPVQRLVGWSADGAYLLFLASEGASVSLTALHVEYGAAVGPPVRVRSFDGVSALGVSRAGGMLYAIYQRPAHELHRASFDVASGRVGASSRVDLSSSEMIGAISWSPDGGRLAYVSWQANKVVRTVSIWVAETGQTTSFTLPFKASTASPITWSADGRWMYLGGWDTVDRGGVFRIRTDSGSVEAVLAPESGVFPAVNFLSTWASLVGWSPDASHVYKRVNGMRNGKVSSVALFEHSIAEHTERELFSRAAASGFTRFSVSPDGRWLAFILHEFATDARSLLVLPAAGGAPRTIAALPASGAVNLRWTPDCRGILLAGRNRDPEEQWLVDVATGRVTILGLTSETVSELTLSPDGTQLAYVEASRSKDDGVWLLENFLPTSKASAVPKPVVPTAKK